MDTIELHPDLREQVELAARWESRSIQEIVNSAVADYVRTQHRAVIARETAAFERLHDELLQSHRGQWVAIHDERLVDSDSDLSVLHTRIRKAYGRAPILLTQVLNEPVPVFHIRTPSFGHLSD